MVEKATSAGQSSPYSTGGGGFGFEHRVGALCLARLLSATTMSELNERAPTHVAFQQAPTSAVDDIVLKADAEAGSPAVRLAIACRRRPQFTRSNKETKDLFVSLVRTDMVAEKSEIEDRIALAVSGHQSGTREVGELASLARNQSTAAYFSLINEFARHTTRPRRGAV